MSFFDRLRRKIVEEAIEDAADAVQEKVEDKKAEIATYLSIGLLLLPAIDILASSLEVPIKTDVKTINNFTFNIESVNIKLS